MNLTPSPETERAWAAGFFDGEGSTGFYGTHLQITVGQVNRDNLFRFLDAVGVGTVGKSFEQPNRKPFSQWYAHSDKAIAALGHEVELTLEAPKPAAAGDEDSEDDGEE